MKYTLAFDVYGTMINTSGVFNSLVELLGDKAKPFMDTWRSKQLEFSFRRGLMNQYADFSVCTKDALEYSCLVFQANLSNNQKKALMEEYTVLPVFPDVDAGLRQLKDAGHHLYAFSNGSKQAITKLLSNADIMQYFHGIVSVEDVSTFKPSPLVYQHMNTITNSTKSDSWMISSNAFDVIGAISYGMRSAWVQRSKESFFDPWEVEPTLIIEDLTQLHLKLEN